MGQKHERVFYTENSRRIPTFLLKVYYFLKHITRHLPFWRHPHYVPFVLLSHPRSGSICVHNVINLHPRILLVGEELREFL